MDFSPRMVKNKKKKEQTTSQDGEDTEVMLKVLKNQVTEVKDAMKDNVETLHEREGNLEDLESRATELEEQTTTEFKRLTVKTRKKSKRKARRIYCILASIITAGVILIIILILYFAGAFD